MRWISCLILTFSLSSTIAGERIKATAWQGSATPDLVRTQWPEAQHFFKKESVAVGVAINQDWLLVSVRTGHAQRIRQFQAYGLQLWIGPKKKARQTFGLYFPMGTQVAATTQSLSLADVLVSERTGVEVERGFAALQKVGETQLQQMLAQELGFPVSDQSKDGVWHYRVAIPLNQVTGIELPQKGRLSLHLRTPEPDEVVDLSIKERAEREQKDNNRRSAFGNEMSGGTFSRGLDGTVFGSLKALDLELEVKLP